MALYPGVTLTLKLFPLLLLLIYSSSSFAPIFLSFFTSPPLLTPPSPIFGDPSPTLTFLFDKHSSFFLPFLLLLLLQSSSFPPSFSVSYTLIYVTTPSALQLTSYKHRRLNLRCFMSKVKHAKTTIKWH